MAPTPVENTGISAAAAIVAPEARTIAGVSTLATWFLAAARNGLD
jgi:hypothetical protein